MPFFDAIHRYLPALAGHLGFETLNVTVVNRPRAAGRANTPISAARRRACLICWASSG
jgi:hypothetical protein